MSYSQCDLMYNAKSRGKLLLSLFDAAFASLGGNGELHRDRFARRIPKADGTIDRAEGLS